MTDQIPADKVREIVEKMHHHANDLYVGSHEKRNILIFAQQFAALLPPPPLPTLADMTREERAACQWMQADVYNFDRRMVITNALTMRADLIERDGERWNVDLERVTPRPDLPRLEWPGTGQDGEEATKVDYVSVAGGRTAYGPWTVARLRKKPDAVPESTLAVGSEWEDVDALARACKESGRDQIVVLDHAGGAYIWDEKAGWWEGSAPPKYDPFTITHTGRKADQ